MLPANVTDLVQRDFDTFLCARLEELEQQIRIAESELSYKGLGRSGAAIERFRELYRDVLRDCLNTLLGSFSRALEAFHVRFTSGTSTEISNFVENAVASIGGDFNERLRKSAENMGLALTTNLDEEIKRLTTKARVEVELLLQRLQPQAQQGGVDRQSRFERKAWYERPIGIIALGIIVTVVGGILVYLLTEGYQPKKPIPTVKEQQSSPLISPPPPSLSTQTESKSVPKTNPPAAPSQPPAIARVEQKLQTKEEKLPQKEEKAASTESQQPTVITQPTPQRQEPPAQSHSRVEEPPPRAVKPKLSQDLREFRVEVDHLQVVGGQVVVFLKIINKTSTELGVILSRTRPFVTDNKGSSYSYRESSGIAWSYNYGPLAIGDYFSLIPASGEHTISMRFDGSYSQPQRGSIYSVSLEVIFAPWGAIARINNISGVVPGQRITNISIHGIEAD